MKDLTTGLLLLATLLLSACDEPATVTPEIERPVLQRELAMVSRDGDGVLLIPAGTHTELAGTPGVFVLSDDGLARFRMVKAGKRRKQQLEIISGLDGDETLVKGPYTDMLDGSPIRPSAKQTDEAK